MQSTCYRHGGYLANSPDTVAGGTMSAGRVYDRVKKHFYIRVMFTTFTSMNGRNRSSSRSMWTGTTDGTIDEQSPEQVVPAERNRGKNNFSLFLYKSSNQEFSFSVSFNAVRKLLI